MCDIGAPTCAGAKDVLTMLEDRILPGAIVVFDEVGRFIDGCLSSCTALLIRFAFWGDV
jgi:hypothetical protein